MVPNQANSLSMGHRGLPCLVQHQASASCCASQSLMQSCGPSHIRREYSLQMAISIHLWQGWPSCISIHSRMCRLQPDRVWKCLS